MFTQTHTHYTPAVAVGTPWAPWCMHFSQLSPTGERPVAAEGSPPFFRQGAWGLTSVGRISESTSYWLSVSQRTICS